MALGFAPALNFEKGSCHRPLSKIVPAAFITKAPAQTTRIVNAQIQSASGDKSAGPGVEDEPGFSAGGQFEDGKRVVACRD